MKPIAGWTAAIELFGLLLCAKYLIKVFCRLGHHFFGFTLRDLCKPLGKLFLGFKLHLTCNLDSLRLRYEDAMPAANIVSVRCVISTSLSLICDAFATPL